MSTDSRLAAVTRDSKARIVRSDDRHIDAAWALLERCKAVLEAQGIRQWDDVYPTREVIATDVRNGALFVLEEDGRCVAHAALDRRQADEWRSCAWRSAEPALVVHRLCVDPAEQGRGLAHDMMDFAEAYAAASGCASVRLDACSINERSLRLYRRRGYREAGRVHLARFEMVEFLCLELDLAARSGLAPATE